MNPTFTCRFGSAGSEDNKNSKMYIDCSRSGMDYQRNVLLCSSIPSIHPPTRRDGCFSSTLNAVVGSTVALCRHVAIKRDFMTQIVNPKNYLLICIAKLLRRNDSDNAIKITRFQSPTAAVPPAGIKFGFHFGTFRWCCI